MRTTIVKQFKFEAAHQLPYHDGKCQHLHGHSYVVEVEVSGPVVPVANENEPDRIRHDAGMVMDFGEVSAIWKAWLEPRLDHQFLNSAIPELAQAPTAERLAVWIMTMFWAHWPKVEAPAVTRVRLWETATAYAEVTA